MQRIDYKVILILLGAILYLCGDSLSGTTGKIAGQVTDEAGDPLPGVAVIIEGTRRGTETDVEGIYFLLSVEPGKHTIVASMVGFEAQRREEVVVSSDFTTNEAFELKELLIQQQEIVVEAQLGSEQWGMLSMKANAPSVEADRTTSKFVIRAGDIEALSALRTMEEFIELQAG
ncbi:MAG: carboxypeptidase-like regulatory domain-containing protein, partial [bacterium]|nr:carboxypeptidase-like regulatory domain-containing protein [bacterium]